jgi:hypothetical protein
VHILAVTTGLPHPKATKHVFDDLITTTSIVIDVETCISGETVSLAYGIQEAQGIAPVSVINWVTGDVLVGHFLSKAGHRGLISHLTAPSDCHRFEQCKFAFIKISHGDPLWLESHMARSRTRYL